MSYFSMPTPARISLLLPLSNNTLFSAQYWGFDLSTVMAVRALHSAKAEDPIDVTEDGMFMEVRALQFAKAENPIDVTEDGMFMAVRALQFAKAEDPIDVTEDGMFMAVRALQPWNVE